MKFYEKPTVEFVKFESEEILLELHDIGDEPGFSEGSEEW